METEADAQNAGEAAQPDPPRLDVHLEHAPRITLAAWQNDVPFVERVVLHNPGSEALDDVTVELTADPPFCAPWTARIDRIAPGGTHTLDPVRLEASTTDLARRVERVKGHLKAEVRAGEQRVGGVAVDVELLAPTEWPGAGQLPELLAAFVLPNASALVPVLKAAAARLDDAGHGAALDGYQSRDRQRVAAMAHAIYGALGGTGVTYINPPASFERSGQKVRTPQQVVGQMGTCLDLSAVLCALFEQAGLHPLLVMVDGHAFVGVWLTEFSSPQPTIDDCALLNKRLRLGDLLVVDSSPVATGGSFAEARAAAARHLTDPDRFRFAVDIRRARRMRVRPLPLGDDGGVDPERLDGPPESSPIEGDTSELPAREDPSWLETKRERTRIQRWKDRLLDLSLRNRMLNFRPGTYTLSFPAVAPGALEDALARGRALEVHPRGELRPARGERAAVELDAEGIDVGYAHQEQAEGRLRVDLPVTDFDKRILELYRRANSSLRESGAVTLYLALGMLRWYEAPSSEQPRLAPLLLVPVTLERGRGARPWRMRIAAEQTRFNSTLLRKLQVEFGLDGGALEAELPEDEAGVDVDRVLNRVRQLVLSQTRWDVLDTCVLARFSFAKYLMWLDLEARTDALMANPIVRRMMEGGGKLPWAAEPVAADALDGDRSPAQVFTVVDADPSQLQAVLAAADGASFVLQGPPGTGKSQTITNLIAQCMAAGRKVLFVSEKMAALEVVRDRLSRIGLGPFCLELHSQTASKRAVMGQIAQAFEALDGASPTAWQAAADRLVEARERLNAFARALGAPTPLGGTVQSSLGRLMALQHVDAPTRALSTAPSAEQVEALRQAAPGVARACAAVGSLPEHPLREIGLSRWDPTVERGVRSALEAAMTALAALIEADAAAADVLGLEPVGDLAASATRDHLVETLLAGPVATRALVEQRPDAVAAHVDRLAAAVRARAEAWSGVAPVFTADVLAVDDLPAVHQRYRAWVGRHAVLTWLVLWLFGPHRRLAALSADGRLPGFAAVRDALERAVATGRAQRDVDAIAADGRALLGHLWQGAETDLDVVRLQVQHAATLHRAIAAESSEDARRRLYGLASDEHGRIEAGTPGHDALVALRDARAAWLDAAGALGHVLTVDPGNFDGASTDVTERLRRWQGGLGGLRDWTRVRAALDPIEGHGLGAVVAGLLAGRLPPERVGDIIEHIVHAAWWEHTLTAEPLFRDFRGRAHEEAIAHFRRLDTEMMTLARQEVRARIAARAPQLDAPGDEMALLRRQLKLKARHKPLRTLFREIPETLGRIKPCVLMSPLSVARYLDPAADGFDVVVFDEASQIPPWDAIGALARGRQAVVVGDSRQLPPTAFFGGEQGDDEADELDLQEMESILDEASAVLPERMLRWHYRSRHESLITFSNHHYYENRLNTFPSAALETPELGVRWHHVPDGFYDRGRSRTNRAEAEAVIAELTRVLDGPGARSVGVVTFSMTQQRLIEDLVDALRQQRPDLEGHFTGDEPVFIKNLENVQGDERDVMLFSIGYGPDRAGKVTMNFGPLNREGGERRLNVAITRARRRLSVFSTLRAEHIDLSRTRAIGARHLKTFLAYAERGAAALDAVAVAAPQQVVESPFEAQVMAAIEARGWQVHAQIGCSGYRIDLAVVDPEAPGAYLLGIECDGATYHGSATARERDRLRQQVLEGLGWRIHRVWSTDWWFDRDRQIERLEAAIEAARQAAEDARRRRAAAEQAASPATEEPAVDGASTDAAPNDDAPSDVAATDAAPSDVAATDAAPDDGPTADDAPPWDAAPAASPATAAEVAPQSESPTVEPPAAAPASPSFAARLEEAERRTTGAEAPVFAWPEPAELGAADDFYLPSTTDAIDARLADVVRACGPVLRDDAFRHVVQAWQLRLTGKARALLEARWARIEAEGGFGCTDDTLWPPDLEPSTWRAWRTSSSAHPRSARTAAQIPPAERVNAAEWVLGRAKVINRATLAREAARVFGFGRMSSTVKAAMDDAIERLDASGRARVVDDRVYVVEG